MLHRIHMSRRLRTRGAMLAVALLASLAVSPQRAAASNYGTALAPTASRQTAPVISQAAAWGASYIAWNDTRNGASDVFFVVVDSAGTPSVSYTPFDGQTPQAGEQKLVPGSRGPWLAWTDSTNDFDVSVGVGITNGWGGPAAYSQTVVAAPGDQVVPRALSLPTGQMFATWQDGRLGSTNTDIYVNVFSGLGPPNPGWPGEVVVCGQAGNQTTPVLCSDGSGGVIIAWVDARSGSTDIYAQRVGPTGAMMWPATGRPVCIAAQAQSGVEIVSDGAGGAIVAWVDGRNGGADIYAQRLSPVGMPMWVPNGIPVCTASGTQDGIALNSDFAGGAYVAWVDGRNGQDIFAEHLDAGGVGTWTSPNGWSNGIALSDPTSGTQKNLRADSDSAGLYLAWEEDRGDGSDIRALAIGVYGNTLWNVIACDAPGDQTSPTILADDASRRGGAVVAWQDARIGAARPQVYAQRIRANGSLAWSDSDRPRLAAVRDVANDQGGRVSLSFTGGALDRIENRLITEFRVWRRVAPTSAIVASAGSGAAALSGRYLARSGAGVLGAQGGAAATTYWEAIATLPAQQLQGYAYTAATTQDSIADTHPYTAFFLTALAADQFTYFESNVDSGYSVDNLAPAAVQHFGGWGTYSTTKLHWDESPEADFGTYRLYRGSSADFTPGTANLVTEQPDTGYVDVVSGSHYYKIVAVDVHGNASAATLLAPSLTNGVDAAAMARLYLSIPSPNPVRGQAAIAYGIARDGNVSLELFDIRGARIRTLARGRQSAGEHVAHWDGRDDTGARVARGVYFYRLVTGEGTQSRRLVLAD